MNLEHAVSWTEWLPSGEESVAGSVKDFMQAVVDHQPGKRLPPLMVLEDILSRGCIGGGMEGGLQWHSIAVDAVTYELFKATLPPDRWADACDATRVEEWRAWCATQDAGVPYAQHLALLERLRNAEVNRDQDGDASELEYINAITDYFSFMASQKKTGQ